MFIIDKCIYCSQIKYNELGHQGKVDGYPSLNLQYTVFKIVMVVVVKVSHVVNTVLNKRLCRRVTIFIRWGCFVFICYVFFNG